MKKQDWIMDFRRNLMGMMREKNMSQRELAEKSNLSEGIISRYLNCQRYPSAITLVNLAYALGCDLEDLAWSYDLIEE